MKFASYWQDTAPAFTGGSTTSPSGHYDVAVIGAGFTGLGAARRLAMEGRRVIVLEAETVGFGASGRNGGHLNNGVAHSFTGAIATYGVETAKAMYKAFDDGIDTIERIIAEEGIDCNFRRAGKLKLASKPQHYEGLARNLEAINRTVDPDTAMLTRAELAGEIGSDIFHGAMLQKKSAMMHMGRFVVGLAEAAARHGAEIHEKTPVTGRRQTTAGHELETPEGIVRATKVVLATGAYTPKTFSYFRRRIVPVGSFLLATRPLTETEVQSVMPGNRTCVTSLNVGNYFRLAPDNRLIFGGRARFSATSNQTSDEKSGRILKDALQGIFPQLGDIAVDYCWGGLVDMTKDRFPRAGEADGVHFAMGYSGHGAQIATHMGEIIADQILGRVRSNPWAELPWPAIPGHLGQPWFLPLVGAYYKFKDRIG
ncbi:glycine/D-amino acid oxidase-like deaminating enzyme [Peteryoungia aggregata LMG 23059]|uniref:Glycine/D-amino acid oxidase-like deaminating enzyme n=1 Tax=Peteryoungia aggregata LMG 23059 TaxID=1368425 RepID=A0ABU0GBU8_9HYPH|nr:FAD-binding oxidoreductase [Peteryoungia aggregata]MDQ0422424.1 glycine/D-amino acid oxidase-like deaminating enzyme [Peteryoungia aggregata LMG 23059]